MTDGGQDGWRASLLAVPVRIRWAACVVHMAAVAVLSLLPVTSFPSSVSWLPGADKLVHVAMYGALGALLRWAVDRGGAEVAFSPELLLPAAAGYGLLMEILQSLFTNGMRAFGWDDMVANVVGVLVFWRLAERFFRGGVRNGRGMVMSLDSLLELLPRWRRAVLLVIHAVLAALVYYGAFALRFDMALSGDALHVFAVTLPVAVAIKLIVFQFFRLHSGILRYASVGDLIRIAQAATLSTLVMIAAMAAWFHLEGYSRSVFAIDWLGTIFTFGGWRLAVRIVREGRLPRWDKASGIRTLVIGAGGAGAMVVRESRRDPECAREFIGFLDDDPAKLGLAIDGVNVLGPLASVRETVEARKVSEVLIAIPSVGRKLTQQVVEACAGLDMKLRIVPSFSAVVEGRVEIRSIRDVNVEDLLDRDPIQLDRGAVVGAFAGKRVLISGAGGSIGAELARQAAALEPAQLILLDVAETPLFNIDQELGRTHPLVPRTAVIANISDPIRVERVFTQHRPDYILHAAAYKHVPLMESFPCDAVHNNLRGTRVLAEAARRHGAKKFVMISTDKAVRPSNVMGATKRLCEMLVGSMNGGGTHFASVRFGNVLGSNGSVVPTFRRQIAAGGPVTVTHAEMTRYFMTIPEAVSLVLQCASMAAESDVYVLDMGTPVKIMDLARTMIALSGFRVGDDIEIAVTGLRPGEKIHEELVTYGEAEQNTDVPKVRVLRREADVVAPDLLRRALLHMEEVARRQDPDATLKVLWKIIGLDGEVGTVASHPAGRVRVETLRAEWETMLNETLVEPAELPVLRSGGRILVVDDDEAQLSLVVRMIERLGVGCVSATSGRAAVETFSSMAPSGILCVVCDYFLPDMNGDEILRRIRDVEPDVPFAFMTGYGRGSREVSAIAELPGVVTVLQKPFGRATLQKLLSSVPHQGRGPSRADPVSRAGRRVPPGGIAMLIPEGSAMGRDENLAIEKD